MNSWCFSKELDNDSLYQHILEKSENCWLHHILLKYIEAMYPDTKKKNNLIGVHIPNNKVSIQTHNESANDSLNNVVNDFTNVLPSSLEKNHDIVVNTCNDSISNNKVSKQTQEESANDSLNNAVNDFTNPLPSSL